MTDLTGDELTVLMIAAQGESMMAIGRWQKPIESLLGKGLMMSRGGDNFNCVITPQGRKACETQDQADQDAFKRAVNKVRRPRAAQPEYTFQIWQSGVMVASCTSAKKHIALREIANYAAQYEQDGPIEIREIEE